MKSELHVLADIATDVTSEMFEVTDPKNSGDWQISQSVAAYIYFYLFHLRQIWSTLNLFHQYIPPPDLVYILSMSSSPLYPSAYQIWQIRERACRVEQSQQIRELVMNQPGLNTYTQQTLMIKKYLVMTMHLITQLS